MLHIILNQSGTGRCATNCFHLTKDEAEMPDTAESLYLCGSSDAGQVASGSGIRLGTREWFERARSYWRGGLTAFLSTSEKYEVCRRCQRAGLAYVKRARAR